MSTQVSLPVDFDIAAITRKRTLGAAIEFCAELGGFALDKQLASDMGVDKAQFSRWMNGEEGIKWPKLEQLQDVCGNDVPTLWMMHSRGWDLHSFRKLESETERQNRELREENAALKRVLLGVRG